MQPLVNLLREELLDAPMVFGDETELQVLKEPGRSARTKSYIWAQMTDGSGRDGTGPPIRLFSYSPSRSTAAAMTLYAGIREGAVLMTDGYDVYDTVAKTHGLVHLGCWTHCRRYFHEALQALPKEQRSPDQLAAKFIKLIGDLYKIEAQAKLDGADAAEVGRRRERLSAVVLEDIKSLLLTNLHAVLPKSLLGQALHYLASQWEKLARFVEDGRYSLDNNAQENAIRRSASDGKTGCSRIPSPAPPPARTCTRCCRPAGSAASTGTDTCAPCSPNCREQGPWTTMRHCCPGASR